MISLVGLPGCGKSTLGARLARHMARRFVDADREIESELGCSIARCFAELGEMHFRDIEASVVARLMNESDAVVAMGGGAVLRQASRTAMRERSTVIYLHAMPERLAPRIRDDARRPLFAAKKSIDVLATLYAERDPLYRQIAHCTVEMDGRPLPKMVDHVAERLRDLQV